MARSARVLQGKMSTRGGVDMCVLREDGVSDFSVSHCFCLVSGLGPSRRCLSAHLPEDSFRSGVFKTQISPFDMNISEEKKRKS